MDELDEEVNNVNSMNEEELRNHEEAMGFLSFGRAAEEIYFPIVNEIEESSSEFGYDQAMEYVSAYPEYLELIINEESEYEFLIKYDFSPFSYIMNTDRMFQVGDNIYKVFSWVILEAELEKADLLHNVTEEDIAERAEEIIELFFSENSDENQEGITKKANLKYLDPSLPLRPKYISSATTKSGGITGGGTVVGGGPNPPGGGGSGGGTTPTSNYGQVQEFYSLIYTTESGNHERVNAKLYIDIDRISGVRYARGYALIKGLRSNNNGKTWFNSRRTLSVDLTMETYFNGAIRSGSLNFTLGSAQLNIKQIIVPDRGTAYNGNNSKYYITKINGKACIPAICTNDINLN
jgi:hypothetical protein